MLTNPQLEQRLAALEESTNERIAVLVAEIAALHARIDIDAPAPTSTPIQGEMTMATWHANTVEIVRSVDGEANIGGDVVKPGAVNFAADVPLSVRLDNGATVVTVGSHVFERFAE
jgi:hypothetical protein